MEGTVGYRKIRYRCYAKDYHDLDQMPRRSTHAAQASSGHCVSMHHTGMPIMPTDNGSDMPILGPMVYLLCRACLTSANSGTFFAVIIPSPRHITLHTTDILHLLSSS
jgi:hypothetical protein